MPLGLNSHTSQVSALKNLNHKKIMVPYVLQMERKSVKICKHETRKFLTLPTTFLETFIATSVTTFITTYDIREI